MHALRWRIARWMLAHCRLAWALFAAATLFFAAGLPRVQLRTIFSDLLPKDDPFVQVYKAHPNFGSPLTVLAMIRRTDGDIYNADTLAKVWQFTRDIDLAPGVDHEQILSCLSDDIEWTVFGAFHLTGKRAYDEAIDGPDFAGPPRLDVVRMVEQDDVVMAELYGEAPRPDGTVLRMSMAEVFRMRDGKIAEHWDVIQPVPDKPVNSNSMF